MSWFKIITSYFVIGQMVFGSVLAQAQNQTQNGAPNAAKNPEPPKFESQIDPAGQRLRVVNEQTKDLVADLPVENDKTLTQYSPKNLNKRLAAEIAKLKTANNAALSHTVKSFPVGTTMFFMALGGLTAIQLFTDYANNPVGMKQHIEHQLSPVGQIGFFLFMYSQGVTSNVLNMWLQRPSLGIPINGLGMTAGYMVQTYFSQVVMDPQIRACAARIFKGEVPEDNKHPCEGAYKYFVVDKKILEGPGVASLIGAFAIEVGTKMVATVVLKKLGINIGLWLATGGTGAGVRWAVSMAMNGLNIAAFTVIQLKLEHMVTNAWTNYFDGKEFVHFNDDLIADIEAQKRSQWKIKTKDMTKNLKEFSKKMGEWRANNLSEAYMAHQAWSEFLMGLTSMYSASYSFYSGYMDHLNSENSYIDRPYPLFGVTPKGLAPGHENLHYLRPDRIERLQTETTLDVTAWLNEKIQNGYYRNLGFNKEQHAAVVRIQAGLANEDINVKGQSILELNKLIEKHSMTVVGSMEFGRELVMIKNMLGKPEPMFEKGRGFAASMQMAPEMMSTFKDLKIEKINGRFATPSPIDYFVVQMICGPEIAQQEKVISIVKGYPAKFTPPALALDNGDKDSLCFGVSTQPWAKERLYNLPIVQQKSAPEYIRANMDPEASKDFLAWWEKGTEAQLKDAFKTFSRSYKEVVAKLFKGLNNTKMSAWNRGFISNGAIIASFQEMRLYSLILGELLKDAYKIQNNQALPSVYFDSTPEQKLTLTAVDYNKSKKPLLALLGRGSRYDFNTLVSAQPNATAYSLKIQKDLENQFAVLNAMVQKARNTPIKSEELQNQMKEVEARLSQFSELLGISKENPAAGLVRLNEGQKALAVTCLELLQSVSQELALYANMVATATYPEKN